MDICDHSRFLKSILLTKYVSAIFFDFSFLKTHIKTSHSIVKVINARIYRLVYVFAKHNKREKNAFRKDGIAINHEFRELLTDQ